MRHGSFAAADSLSRVHSPAHPSTICLFFLEIDFQDILRIFICHDHFGSAPKSLVLIGCKVLDDHCMVSPPGLLLPDRQSSLKLTLCFTCLSIVSYSPCCTSQIPRQIHEEAVFMVQNLQVSGAPAPRGMTILLLLPGTTDSAVLTQRHSS